MSEQKSIAHVIRDDPHTDVQYLVMKELSRNWLSSRDHQARQAPKDALQVDRRIQDGSDKSYNPFDNHTQPSDKGMRARINDLQHKVHLTPGEKLELELLLNKVWG